ncbi:MAG: acyl carrier protein [Nanoarchaeota archaeon]|nr:acyl carrier protein [Nanoarchaeota archaeon]
MDEVTKEVVEIFKKTFPELKDAELDLDKNQESFENWDSFAHMELVGGVEEKFGITLEISEVVDLDTPKKFVEIIEKKKA